MLLTKIRYKNFINSGYSYTKPDLDAEIRNISLKEGSYTLVNTINKKPIISKKHQISLRKNALIRYNNSIKLPVVLAFYSTAWGELGVQFLKAVENLKRKIEWRDAELLVLSSDDDNDLLNIIEEHNLSLNIYQDEEDKIARYFGVYSDEKPVWHYVSGIDKNACYLSVFVISKQKTITYKHIYLAESGVFDKNLLSAIA